MSYGSVYGVVPSRGIYGFSPAEHRHIASRTTHVVFNQNNFVYFVITYCKCCNYSQYSCYPTVQMTATSYCQSCGYYRCRVIEMVAIRGMGVLCMIVGVV
jgi:hypothetical protein